MSKTRSFRAVRITAGPYESCYDIIDVVDDWKEITKAMGCEYMEITSARIGGKNFTIICDEEGLLKENLPTVVSVSGRLKVMGTILLIPYHSSYFKSITDELAEHLKHYVHHVYWGDKKIGVVVLDA